MTIPSEYLPTFYPRVTDQWVWGAGDGPDSEGWQSQASSCVANAICTMKEIHEYRQLGTANKYSIGWVYGNRLETDLQGETMRITEALNRLIADGVPVYTDLPENLIPEHSASWSPYPDTYFYYDWTDNGQSIIGAQTLVENNYDSVVSNARFAKISSYQTISAGSANIDTIKQSIIDNGAVLIYTYIANNFDNLGGEGCTGIVPAVDYNIEIDGNKTIHTMAITGWKIISGTTYWIVHNNWGNWWWGDENRRGYCYMPLDYSNIINYYLVVDYQQTIIPPSITYAGATSDIISITWTKASTPYDYSTHIQICSDTTGSPESLMWDSVDHELTLTVTSTGIDVDNEYLQYGQTYYTRGAGRTIDNSETGSPWGSWSSGFAIPDPSRPSDFSWTYAKVSGENINLTAIEWNSFCSKINAFRKYVFRNNSGVSAYNFTPVVSGGLIYAYMFNQAILALDDMNPPTSPPFNGSGTNGLYKGVSDVVIPILADDIRASDINLIVTSLNSIN